MTIGSNDDYQPEFMDKPAVSAAVLAFLQEHGPAVTEYQLIQHLNECGLFDAFAGESSQLQLFKKHFITRHCLYELQQNLPSDWCLLIGPVTIQLQKTASSIPHACEAGFAEAGLRDFYLDLRHLEQADDESVSELLRGFRVRFNAWNSCDEASKTLELQPDASWTEIQRAYRRKIQRLHPDAGGNAESFARVREAYLILKKRFES